MESSVLGERPAWLRRAQRVLTMVGELHKQGYRRLRIMPGWSSSGAYWRCSVVPIDSVLVSNGSLVPSCWWDRVVATTYTTGQDNQYFGWPDASGASARELAGLFIDRLPDICDRGLGRDWTYAGWYTELLGFADQGFLPVAYDEGFTADVGHIRLVEGGEHREYPLPPPGEGVHERCPTCPQQIGAC